MHVYKDMNSKISILSDFRLINFFKCELEVLIGHFGFGY